ncbi:MAG TPA: hypothetical protein PLL75_05725 [Candidatus Omnitrophota bacterium]|nr:hypothetical protein [Candidatus Omnitrophota bacterium]HPS37206.1 hypothetical protein [Candidatus Omnitrophota bacterium]
MRQRFGMIALAVFGVFALVGSTGAFAEPEAQVEYDQPGENLSDPSAFQGDSDDMAGERAPENFPMDDEPGEAGIGVE